MAEQHTVCFTITGEFITRTSRDLWMEGKPDGALRILEAAFPDMEPDLQVAIAMGYKKLEGDSNVGITVEPDKGPVASELLGSVTKPLQRRIEKLEDEVEFFAGELVSISSPHGLIQVPKRRTVYKTIKCQTRRVLDGDWDLLEHIPWKKVFTEDRQKEFFSPSTELERQERLNLEPPPPEPDPEPPPPGEREITSDDGWLSPEGLFYRCWYGGHINLAGRLGIDSTDMEKRGWMKIQEGKAWNITIYSAGLNTIEPTQKQIDAVFDWYTKRKKELPYWMKPESDD